ncbi:anti-sigma factor [Marinoscillum furvescens]|uniref:Uncharacterized protein n=1 Tax=Marinoscillum furvescens DSM 4134 TaxID=1122208 RepID=A0A3D9L2K5_MARFU|nr:hypothetical protein [Marinoscillum furvescens]RED98948.1 hypothetical protein C7460_109140 [Marinoscillum furvescens DSM 4134]
MTKTFTKNDLVRFLYDELTNDEKRALAQALLTDNELQNELDLLRSTMTELSKVSYKPSQRSVDKILEFSKGYHKQSV